LSLEDLQVFNRKRLSLQDPILLGDEPYSAREIVEGLSKMVTEERLLRIKSVVSSRCLRVAPVLENIFDRGNISAVMRSAESFGFVNFHVIEQLGAKFKAANRVTKGSEKWLDIQVHQTAGECVTQLKSQGFQIFATHLEATHEIEEIDWTKPTAFVLGNEKDGVSDEMMSLASGSFKIPMSGFSQSFNISVAGALVLYHAALNRKMKLGSNADLSEPEQELILANYLLRCFDHPENLMKKLRL